MNVATEPLSFGRALRRWREACKVSQLELAMRAGTTQRHLSFVEGGRSAPGRPLILRLAESLDLPLRERNALLHSAGYAPAFVEILPGCAAAQIDHGRAEGDP